MRALGPAEIRRILAVTDDLGIHRESVSIPLAPRGEGSLRILPSRKIEIVAPEHDYDGWLEILPQRLSELDLTGVRRSS